MSNSWSCLSSCIGSSRYSLYGINCLSRRERYSTPRSFPVGNKIPVIPHSIARLTLSKRSSTKIQFVGSISRACAAISNIRRSPLLMRLSQERIMFFSGKNPSGSNFLFWRGNQNFVLFEQIPILIFLSVNHLSRNYESQVSRWLICSAIISLWYELSQSGFLNFLRT